MKPVEHASGSTNTAPALSCQSDNTPSSAGGSAKTAVGVRSIIRWLLSSTRSVLGPLAGSAMARLVDQILGIVLFAVPAVLLVNLVKSYLDCGCIHSSFANVGGLVTIMTGTALLKGLARYLEQYWGHLVAFKALELLRAQAYRAIFPQAPAIVTDNHSGDLLSRLTKDIDRIEVFFAHTFAPALTAFLIPSIVTVATFAVAPWQIGVTVAGILMVGLLIPWLGIYSGHLAARKKLAARGRVAVDVTDSLGGLAEVVGYGLCNARLTGSDKLGEALVQASLQEASKSAFRGAFLSAWRMAAVLILLAVGAPLYQAEALGMAAWIAIIFAVLRCWDGFNAVVDFGTELNTSLAAARRVYQLTHAGLELCEGTEDVPQTTPVAVEFSNVSFRYPESTHTISQTNPTPGTIAQVSLKLAPSSWTALVGATGSGKSTLARLLLRFYDPDTGTVRLDGRSLRDYRLASLRDAVSLVNAESTIFDMTIAENLRLSRPQASDQQLWWALAMAGLDEEVKAMSGGLQHRVASQGTDLSGGQRQRLSLARALLRQSQVLILDEHTAHLPPSLASGINDNLRAMVPRPTVLEITHNLDQIAQADWVAVLDLGLIVEQGKPEDLLANPESALRHLRG